MCAYPSRPLSAAYAYLASNPEYWPGRLRGVCGGSCLLPVRWIHALPSQCGTAGKFNVADPKHRRSGANASSRHLHLLGTTWAGIAPPETPHQVSVACSHTARCECRLAADSGPAQAAATASGRLFSAGCVTLQVGDPESHFRFIYKGRYAWFCIEQKGPSPGDLTRNEAYAFMQMHRPHRERRSWISGTHLATGTKLDVVLGVCFHCHELMPRKGRSSGGLFYWWTSTKTRLIHGSGIANVSSC
jgi:hypothetical protein